MDKIAKKAATQQQSMNASPRQIGLKIDVDTERGTAEGLMALCQLLSELHVPATIYLALGPDNTGRALRRLWHPGFLAKCLKTKVVSSYGLRTILHGLLWPGPHIGGKHGQVMRSAQRLGFEMGIHCFDHQRWQNGVSQKLNQEEIIAEFGRAADEFERIFDCRAITAAAPGWQANHKTLSAYQYAGVRYASDCRGYSPFYPVCAGTRFSVLQLPTTLPTLDELLVESSGNANQALIDRLRKLTDQQSFSLFTLHAELEGMYYLAWFQRLLAAWRADGYQFASLGQLACRHQSQATDCELIQQSVPNRAGKLAMQGAEISAKHLQ